jgi:hypothetical protein
MDSNLSRILQEAAPVPENVPDIFPTSPIHGIAGKLAAFPTSCRRRDPAAIGGQGPPHKQSIAPGRPSHKSSNNIAPGSRNAARTLPQKQQTPPIPVGGPRPFPTGLRHFPHPCGSRDPAAIGGQRPPHQQQHRAARTLPQKQQTPPIPVGGPRPFPTGLRHFPHPCGSRDPAAMADKVRLTSNSIAPGHGTPPGPSHNSSRRHQSPVGAASAAKADNVRPTSKNTALGRAAHR